MHVLVCSGWATGDSGPDSRATAEDHALSHSLFVSLELKGVVEIEPKVQWSLLKSPPSASCNFLGASSISTCKVCEQLRKGTESYG